MDDRNAAGAALRWRHDLAAWQIPAGILAAAEEPPWELPRAVFLRRAADATAIPGGPSYERAWEALDPPGSVLDVGPGGGAASLPLAGRTTHLTGVDVDDQMLGAFAAEAARLGLQCTPVNGRWPDIAGEVAVADVVVCHHVFYNVPDLRAFATELSAHARRRVVVELTAQHPLVGLNPLWRHFHGLDRPDVPTAGDALAVVAEAGIEARAQRWQRPALTRYPTFAALVDLTRRRLCLPAARTAEVEVALRDLGVDETRPDLGSSGRDLVTVWWPGRG